MAQKAQPENLNIPGMVKEFEMKLERLKTLYEQYFMGIEKREPRIPLHEVVRLMRELDKTRISNTRLRYRYRSLVQRFNTYRTYWHRTIRAIENGTYHRDLAKLRRKWAQKGMAMPTTGRMRSAAEVERAVGTAIRSQQQEQAGEGDPPDLTAQSRRKVPDSIRGASSEELRREYGDDAPPGASEQAKTNPRNQVVRPARTPPPARATGGGTLPEGFTEGQMQSIYRRYVKAKRMVGEDVSGVRYDTLSQSLSRQVPRLKQLNKGRDVDFDVVIRQGKVVLKAKPK